MGRSRGYEGYPWVGLVASLCRDIAWRCNGEPVSNEICYRSFDCTCNKCSALPCGYAVGRGSDSLAIVGEPKAGSSSLWACPQWAHLGCLRLGWLVLGRSDQRPVECERIQGHGQEQQRYGDDRFWRNVAIGFSVQRSCSLGHQALCERCHEEVWYEWLFADVFVYGIGQFRCWRL
jgi:hypothetical protein